MQNNVVEINRDSSGKQYNLKSKPAPAHQRLSDSVSVSRVNLTVGIHGRQTKT